MPLSLIHICADGKPEIVPEEAEIIKRIYAEYLAGASLSDIANGLIRDGILTPKGKNNWTTKGVLSILTNEKYKGDALLQKTYIVDCISKKSKKNTGELPMYYVETVSYTHLDVYKRQLVLSFGLMGLGSTTSVASNRPAPDFAAAESAFFSTAICPLPVSYTHLSCIEITCSIPALLFISFLIIRYFFTRCNPENVKTGSTV